MISAQAESHTYSSRLTSTEGTRRGRLLYGAIEYPCTVLRLSAGGAQIRMPHPIRVWATVTLAIEGIGALHGRVVWQRGDTLALQFVQNALWVSGKIVAAAS